jgi:hypothetical protein
VLIPGAPGATLCNGRHHGFLQSLERFPKQESLRRLYPALLGHAITTFGGPNVLRFLGKPTRLDGKAPRWYSGELFSDLKQRVEGMRIKHYLDRSTPLAAPAPPSRNTRRFSGD